MYDRERERERGEGGGVTTSGVIRAVVKFLYYYNTRSFICICYQLVLVDAGKTQATISPPSLDLPGRHPIVFGSVGAFSLREKRFSDCSTTLSLSLYRSLTDARERKTPHSLAIGLKQFGKAYKWDSSTAGCYHSLSSFHRLSKR